MSETCRKPALKGKTLATDGVPSMRSLMYRMTPVLLFAAGLGCSKGSTKPAHFDAGKVSEAGAIDLGSASADGPRRLDARDASSLDLSVVEAGAVRDSKDTAPPRDASRDALGDVGVADTAGNRDSSPEGMPDGNLDLFQEPDLPVDNAPILGTCTAPIEIPSSVSHIDLSVNTASAPHLVDFPCVSNGGDIVFRIESNQPEMAYADTFGTAWNTALLFTDACDSVKPPASAGMVTCSDDACGTTQSQAFARLDYGYHYLIVSGPNGEGDDVVVHFQRAPVGNGPLVLLPMGSGTVVGTTEGMDSTRTCDTSGPKNSYWWANCPTDVGGTFHASTCKGADWDTFLILQIPRQDTLLCTDDDPACGMQSTVDAVISPGAGLSVLTVAGTLLRSSGDYTLAYTRP
jgi:hypothetical protein